MGQLEDMSMFVRIVDAGSITKAATQLDVAKSAVSRRLNQLEDRLGQQLLSRTTRKSMLTEAGEYYYHRASAIVYEVQALNDQHSSPVHALEGTLRLTAPLSFGLMHLAPLLDEFSTLHPQLRFVLNFSDQHIDMLGDGFDLAIRIGALADSSLQAKRVTTIRHVLCASPAYLAQNGVPLNIDDLVSHQFLMYALTPRIEVQAPCGAPRNFTPTAKFSANNGDFLIELARQGHGVTYVPSFLAYEAVARGDLQLLLCDHVFKTNYAYAVYPQTRYLSQRCRAFIDFVAAKFTEEPYWDTLIEHGDRSA